MSPVGVAKGEARPEPQRLVRASWVRWGLIMGAWVLLSIFLAPEVYLYFLGKNEPIPWEEAFSLTFVNAAIAAAFTPFIVWLTGKFPLERGKWPWSLLVHVPACIVFSVSHSWLYAMLCYASPHLSEMLFVRFHPNILTYWAIVGFAAALDYFEKYKERERELAQAQMQLLKIQLQPHFLFNTLHTISAMMHEDVKSADRMISRLSDLLRHTLDNIGKHEIPLREEVDFLQKYLEIQRVRFEDRLSLSLDIAPEMLDVMVPSMLLQPLAENSIKHGFASGKNTGVITVRARGRDGFLVLTVTDDGRGLQGAVREGVGLTNIRRRLEQLYNDGHGFTIEGPPEGGVAVTMTLPIRMATGRGGLVEQEKRR